MVHNNYNDGDLEFSGTRRNRSRSRERKRYARSRSRSGSRERKRSRPTYIKSENNGTPFEKERHGTSFDAGIESGEIEEGEDRSYDTDYKRTYGNNNGQTFVKTEDFDDGYHDSHQPAYVAYSNHDDD